MVKKNIYIVLTAVNLRFLQVLFVCLLFLLTSCGKDKPIQPIIPLCGEYLPLQVQNYWDIEHKTRISITGTEVIDGKTYYIFDDSNTFMRDYYRSENGKVYTRRTGEPESVKFDLTADVRDTWEYLYGGGTWTATLLSKTDTLQINNTKIPNCYKFYFDIPIMADEEYYVWLAPGIGFIRMTCGYCLYPYQNLVKAQIDGKEIWFP